MPYFIIASIFFLVAVSIFSIILLYRTARKDVNAQFLEKYQSTISGIGRMRFDSIYRMESYEIDEEFINEVMDCELLYKNEKLSEEEKRKIISEKNTFIWHNLQENSGMLSINAPYITIIDSGNVFYENCLFINPKGIILFSQEKNRIFEEYEDFKLLKTYADGSYEEIIFSKPNADRDMQREISIRPSYIIYKTVIDPTSDLVLGYLVCQQNLLFNPSIASGQQAYAFLLSAEGKPISLLKYENEYSAALKFAGFPDNPYETPLVNPVKTIRPEETTNLKFVNSLLKDDIKEDPLIYSKSLYKNYANILVAAAGARIPGMNILIIIETPFFPLFMRYLNSFLWFFLILIAAINIVIISLDHLDKLRLQALDSNPLTHLPGNNHIHFKIQEMIEKKLDAAVIYADLDNFKAYNDQYGFKRGDDVIKLMSEVICKALQPYKKSFCGHIGGDDFIFIIDADIAEETSEIMIRDFDGKIPEYYSDADRKKGYISSLARDGREQKFPLISVSMAGVKLLQSGINHHLEVTNRCTELKKIAKNQAGSVLVMDRRK